MDNTYFTWDDFVEAFGREMRVASEIYNQMVETGLKDGALSAFDYTFVSDEPEKLERLKAFLLEHYPYTAGDVEEAEDSWEFSGVTAAFSVTEDNLTYWALDMAKRGYEFDCEFEAYGAEVDDKTPTFPDVSPAQEDHWFEQGLTQYRAGNLSGAHESWTRVIAINPKNVDAYYSRAIVKSDLHTWKAALRDYDETLQIAPDFWDAWVNRASLKDDHGDHAGAIQDYDHVIANASDYDLAMAFYNRGNSKMKLEDAAGACKDWKEARERGAEYAQARIDQYCKD